MHHYNRTVVVETSSGCLAGRYAAGVVRFAGVPFADPPVGELRFAAPQPVTPWEGVLDATRNGPIAPQRSSRLAAAVDDFEAAQSEDCLRLCITSPPEVAASRPVIVWLHGGGYTSGARSLAWYDGALLASEGDVVVVGVNYRLGPLGFLCADELGDGQAGLHDMLVALEWVSGNIARFGGDPDNVTLAGQSAGAYAILCMLAKPDARKFAGGQSCRVRRLVWRHSPQRERVATLTGLLTCSASRLPPATSVCVRCVPSRSMPSWMPRRRWHARTQCSVVSSHRSFRSWTLWRIRHAF